MPNVSIETRSRALERGQFDRAAMGTLCGTGIVEHFGDECGWDPFAFGSDDEMLGLYPQAPTAESCGQCHGVVHMEEEPLLPELYDMVFDMTSLLTGEVFSWQRISDSGLNLVDKKDTTRSWDLHAQRVVDCVDCHHSENNLSLIHI